MTALWLFLRANSWAAWLLAGLAALAAFLFWLSAHDRAIRADQKAIDRAAFEQALQAAELLAIKAKADAEAHYRKLADETDDKAHAAIADARGAADRYIDRMRGKACPGTPGAAAAPAAGGSPARADGPGGPAFVDAMIPVQAEDIRICSTNTARLQTAREWALELMESGR